MLNFIYYPVSGIMWVWHWLFDHIFPNTPGWDGIAWALSVVFLVFTLRAILYKPFVKQIRTTKKMQEINPQLQAIRKKYAKDRVKMTEEMQKLQKEHGFNPLLGCLPMLLQIPVFIGLFHVLRSFNRMGTGMGQLHMSAQQTRSTGNYFFSVDQVQNFLDARLFGVPLSSFISEKQTEWVAFTKTLNVDDIDFTRGTIAFVVVPLVIISSIATHMNSRASVARQGAAALENPQTRIMNNLALYVFPLGILVSGAFFPVAILLYWVSNNLWTYGQQHLVFGKIAKEEEEAKLAKQEKLKANAPKPGAKPQVGKGQNAKGGQKPNTNGAPAAETSQTSSPVNGQTDLSKKVGSKKVDGAEKADGAKVDGGKVDGSADATASTSTAADGSRPPSAPRPGQRPQGRGQNRSRSKKKR
ncbi:membrane protein insertase YidC [Williamsia sterculiae]|uniref:Membrane protein insertase YidC n=1 Tax=Williamsia sterculiae TaxID=1344003 RepID=A0A1N7FGC3_9NOCA|nr:membrane protein insertase YidC [Williamsia sterculiae]SIR99285.1 YidC/Oxa1 family membrane protein insertase [Williamsia sterculiae]